MGVSSMDGEGVTESILRAVSERRGRPVTELPPLYDVVDPDALDTLASSGHCSVTFDYAGLRVHVGPDGAVDVTESVSQAGE